MFTLLFIIPLGIVLGYYAIVWIKNHDFSSKSDCPDRKDPTQLSLTKIIEKFNSLCKNITVDNLESTKVQLHQLLEQYRSTKAAEFSEAMIKIKHQLAEIKRAEESINNSFWQTRQVIRAEKHHPTMSDHDHALLMHRYKEYERILDELGTKRQLFENRQEALQHSIDMFEGDFALKSAQIVTITCDPDDIQSSSSIDLKLDLLTAKYKTQLDDKKTTQEVHRKVYGAQESSNTPFDETACLEAFNAYDE